MAPRGDEKKAPRRPGALSDGGTLIDKEQKNESSQTEDDSGDAGRSQASRSRQQSAMAPLEAIGEGDSGSLEPLDPNGTYEGDAELISDVGDDSAGAFDSDNSENSGEETSAGPPIKLDIIQGPDQGRSKRFTGVRMVVGRVRGCDLRLSDQSVSRRHLELVHGEKGVLLRDLGSGNGTQVNDEKVSERLLAHLDEVSLGKTRFRFVDEAVAYRLLREQAEVSAAAKKKADDAPTHPTLIRPQRVSSDASPRRRAIAIAGLVLLMVVGALVLARRRMSPQRDEAEAQAKQAEKTLTGANQEKLAVIATDERSAKLLAGVREMLEQKRFEDARRALAEISTPSAARTQEKQTLSAQVEEQALDYQVKQAEDLLDDNQVAAAKQAIAQLPEEVQNRLAAKVAKAEIASKAKERAEQARFAALQAAAQKQTDARREAEIEAAFTQVARKFHSGEYQRAASECDRVIDAFRNDTQIKARAQVLQVMIPSFGRNFEEGHRKFKAGQLASSVKPLRKARELYQSIRFKGALGQQIDEELAAASLALGREAFAKGDLATAATSFTESSKLDPSDSRAKEGLEQVSSMIEKLYEEAYIIREREPQDAIAKLKVVLSIAPVGSAVHTKAKQQLSVLQQ